MKEEKKVSRNGSHECEDDDGSQERSSIDWSILLAVVVSPSILRILRSSFISWQEEEGEPHRKLLSLLLMMPHLQT